MANLEVLHRGPRAEHAPCSTDHLERIGRELVQVLPGLLHVLPVLTPIAAICLAILMAGAVKVHLNFKESPIPAVVPLLLAIFVAVGRFALVPWI
jgi:DoxX-like protein